MTEQGLFRSRDKALKPPCRDLRRSHRLSKAGRDVVGPYHDAQRLVSSTVRTAQSAQAVGRC